MLDKSIPYYNIIMKREAGREFKHYELPDGFRYVLFKPGDEIAWAEIETSVGEFDKETEALLYFQKEYLPLLKELERRCIFVENDAGEKVATFTMWWCYTGLRRDPWVYWVAVRPEFQGLGIGKAIVTEGVRRMLEIEGDRNFYLHTQTWSYKAVTIYKKAGFEITREKGLAGYENNEIEEAAELLKRFINEA